MPECLSPQYVRAIVPEHNTSDNWLAQFLALRDISHFVVGASLDYTVNQEMREVGLQASSANCRDAILHVLDDLHMPPRFPKRELVSTFTATFRSILPDTLDITSSDSAELAIDEIELDALDLFITNLRARQIIHRVSDTDMMRSVSQLVRQVLDYDNPDEQFGAPHPGLYAVNCSHCHLFGASQLRALNLQVPVSAPNTILSS